MKITVKDNYGKYYRADYEKGCKTDYDLEENTPPIVMAMMDALILVRQAYGYEPEEFADLVKKLSNTWDPSL